jgi:hypothetical protein
MQVRENRYHDTLQRIKSYQPSYNAEATPGTRSSERGGGKPKILAYPILGKPTSARWAVPLLAEKTFAGSEGVAIQ